ncbi:olfactory receptor 6B1-like [Hyla sarda]|uniref:olfactory receptor 6B1-like n=1 Tax=Hyla sarda TaxID=327740 RepID=UPI0024C228D6|nr:olfactory receptor 6B1-like [Hyla sarda]
MSYDRYLAICKPLHYMAMMSVQLRYILVLSSWVLGFMLVLISLVLISSLDFCGPNVMNHFFCDYAPLLELSCSDTTVPNIEMIVLCFPIIILPFLLVIISYVCIFDTIFGISSTTGRQKTFSTCSSHLMVVSIYYGSMLIIYIFPYREDSLNVNKFISLVYIVLNPLLNPIIYSLRNKEIQASIMKYVLDCGINVTLGQTVNVAQLQFCQSNVTDHFFCDFDPVLKLSCSDIQTIKLMLHTSSHNIFQWSQNIVLKNMRTIHLDFSFRALKELYCHLEEEA